MILPGTDIDDDLLPIEPGMRNSITPGTDSISTTPLQQPQPYRRAATLFPTETSTVSLNNTRKPTECCIAGQYSILPMIVSQHGIHRPTKFRTSGQYFLYSRISFLNTVLTISLNYILQNATRYLSKIPFLKCYLPLRQV